MPPKSRTTDSGTGKTVPALVNNGYFSEYYLAYRLDAGLAELFKRWDAAEKEGTATARTRVRSLTTALDKYRLDAALTAPDAVLGATAAGTRDDATALDGPLDLQDLPADGVAAQRDLNDSILGALGWTPGRDTPLELISGDRSFTVPIAARCDTHAGTVLVALETVFATDPATIFASKQAAAATLLDPVRGGDRIEARTALETAQVIFTADAPPNYVLVVSGGSITLLDRDRWGEGVYLAANIDDAIARHDTKPRGELAAIAALFSADAINPGDGAQSVLTALLEKAATEAAGVSKELRYGVRRSVELLANAVVRDVRDRQHGAWRSIDPRDLTRQCLRYLYRVIVLLFAEARPELGILPVDDPDYQSGYSLARLRDVALRDLHTDQGRNATHVQDSLAILFGLVNDGYEPEATLVGGNDARGLSFRALRSVLFSTLACPLIDRARIPDCVLQDVIEHLCFSREKSGRQRQSLSYATLGINQLGAVYEGLMSFSGSLATEPLYEIDKDGDPDNGSWVIPVTRADEFPEACFLEREEPGGSMRRVRYETGDFVFRLSGRDRQRSASYYTPEVLTEFTVRHALDVLFDENPDLLAADILNLTVCEPALGSGAFLNEAINQLAARYLKAAQDEVGEAIDPARYQHELQKAKAHFAVNQSFGVDLNQTAVELAEVSLWLNCMHAGLDAPWFGARLRRGNSLIGARRATYTLEQVKAAAWAGKDATPAEQRLADVPLGTGSGVHHFLVPGQGWGAALGAKEVAELDPAWTDAVSLWRSAIQRRPNQHNVERLVALAERVEALWEQSAVEITRFWEATRQHIEVWGGTTAPTGKRYGDETIRKALHDPRSATCRLRRIMDAWCSLWAWAPQHGTGLPTMAEWLDGIEAVLGRPDPQAVGVLFLSGSDDGSADPLAEVEANFPWLANCREIADQQAWFHWELEDAPIFERGGFDVQIGNPPWVRLDWQENVALSELDPFFSVWESPSDDEFLERRSEILNDDIARSRYLTQRAENESITTFLAAPSLEPTLAGVRTNLFMVFMTNTWRRASSRGSIGLIHPEGHFTDPKCGSLRASAYRRQRAHYHFINELKLFAEPSNTREYGVHTYGAPRSETSFRQAAFLYHPLAVDRSLNHDGTGEIPGRKHPEGGWDIRPHRERFVHVTDAVLRDWAALLDHPDPTTVPLIRTVSSVEAEAAGSLARYPQRVGGIRYHWTSGWNEKNDLRRGLIEERTAIPVSLDEVILQGPHIGISNPFAKQPRPTGKNQKDYDTWDLRSLPETVIPRTNWQRRADRATFDAQIDQWDGRPYPSYFRVIARRQVPSNTSRSLFMALLCPGPTAVSVCYMGRMDNDRQSVSFCGLASTILVDFFVRISGVSDLHDNVIRRFPRLHPDHILEPLVVHRCLRLNCLTGEYADIWKNLYDGTWATDSFVLADSATKSLASDSPNWVPDLPIRTEGDRWLVLTELDALAALVLGVSEAGLMAVYRSQFPVLRGYEYEMVFDAAGHQICSDHYAFGYEQARLENAAKVNKTKGWRKVWDRVEAYRAGDTSVDLGPFTPPFRPADREAAMSAAYRAFADRVDAAP